MDVIEAAEARALLHGKGEVALIDLRDAAPFSEAHPLFAVPVDFGLLEVEIARLVPRRGTPMLLLDADDGVAALAALLLGDMGYTDLRAIAGGAAGWRKAGLPLFAGVHVPSKVLGELAEVAYAPRRIGADGLARALARKTAMHFLDVRPPAEHGKMRIAGARCLPNGETAHRLSAFDDDRPLLLTCAGRTRGLIGAASLRLVAPEREVWALEDGTQGWVLSGRELERGATPDPFPELSAEGLAASRARADIFAAAQGVRMLGSDEVARWRKDADRTLFLFDVRSDDEAASDPLPAFAPAPCGQLVQATDRWVGTRRARIVCACDTGLRGALAAFWLGRLGYDTAAVRIDDTLRELTPEPSDRAVSERAPRLSAEAALRRVGEGARLFDLRSSDDWDAGHPEGAEWTTRAALARGAPEGGVVILGDDGPRADLAWRSLPEVARGNATVIDGGLAALARAGAPILADDPLPAARAVDRVSFAAGRHDGNLDASRLYLDWEKGLVDRLDALERAEFDLTGHPGR